MTTQTSRFSVIHFRDIERWIPVRAIFDYKKLPSSWSVVSVGDIVHQVEERVKVEKDKEYKLIGVKWYGEGTFHRETVLGSETSAIYLYPVTPNALIYNRLFAWKKSFAIVPQEHENHFVSGEFPQFIADEHKVLPRFLYLFFNLNATIEAVNMASIGSAAVSRNRFKEEDFLKFKLPLPPLDEQRRIIAAWQQARGKATKTQERIAQIEKDTEDLILNSLGISLSSEFPKQKTFSISWKGLERWDLFFQRPDFSKLENQLQNLHALPLGEILNFESRSWKKSDFPDGKFEYVEISSVNRENGIFSSRTVETNNAPSRATTLIKTGDLIISTTRPYLGAITIVPEKYNNCVCSSGFALATSTKLPDVDIRYVLFFLTSKAGLLQLERRMTGGLYPAIVQEELEKIKIPIPSNKVQNDIMRRVEEGRSKIRQEQEAAAKVAEESESEVEKMILGLLKA